MTPEKKNVPDRDCEKEEAPPLQPLPALQKAVADQKEELDRKTVKKRLSRLFAPRVDGSFLVPPELLQQYKDLAQREQLIDEFINSGLDKDWAGEGCAYLDSPAHNVYIHV